MRVVLAGGGTAGHVEPALAVADALMRHDASTSITFIGTSQGLESRLVPARGYDLHVIPRVPLPRRPSMDVVTLPPRLVGAVRATRAIVDAAHADVVVGFGGYVAMPAYAAARRRRIPIVVHEANVRPGVANRIGARWAQRVLVGFPGTSLHRAELVGIPLRTSLMDGIKATTREQARIELGLDPVRPVVLAFGGSLGAASLNRVVPAVAGTIDRLGGQLLLAAGHDRVDEARSHVAGAGAAAHIVDYLDRMDLAYRAADIVVARAGAMTVAEVTALGLPSILIPLPTGNGEQALNAAPVVESGGALMIRDDELTPDRLDEAITGLLGDRQRRTDMAERAAACGLTDADEDVAEIIRQVVKENRT